MNYRLPFAITLTTLSILAFMGCRDSISPAPQQKEVNQTSPLSDRHLMGEISHGLHMISINDSTQVLIYRGVESCTMIQIK
jgi:hypothetical protein